MLKWDLKKIYEDTDRWEKDFSKYCNLLPKIEYYNGKLINKENILACLKLLKQIELTVEPLYFYAHNLKNLDVSNSKSQELVNKIEGAISQQMTLTSFVIPQLSMLDIKLIDEILADKDFFDFEKIFKDIKREKPHILSEENEKLLSSISLFGDGFSDNFSNFENGDLKFNNVKNSHDKSLPLTESLASKYLMGGDRILRKNAFIERNSAFGRYNNFITSNYLSNVKKDIFYARARKFSTALEASLFYEEVGADIYSRLVSKVEENLSLNHKYFATKKRSLGYSSINLYDIYFNQFQNKNDYTYDQAFDIVCNALAVLGRDYIDRLNEFAEKGQIDVYPDKNKYNGAYESCIYNHDPLVLLNFSGKFNDVSTIAHELGHAMHSYYSNKNQSFYNAGYKIFLAEIASTVNEFLLNDFMLNHSKNDDDKLFFISEFLQTFNATVFRQTMFASFEEKIHSIVENNEVISSEVVNNLYLNLVKKYFGKSVRIHDVIKYEWSRIPHFYTSFYVYKYATGLISAINIVKNLQEGNISVDDYKKFLSSGCTNDPINLLKIVKVDLTDDKTFDKAFSVFKDYLDNFEKLTKSKKLKK